MNVRRSWLPYTSARPTNGFERHVQLDPLAHDPVRPEVQQRHGRAALRAGVQDLRRLELRIAADVPRPPRDLALLRIEDAQVAEPHGGVLVHRPVRLEGGLAAFHLERALPAVARRVERARSRGSQSERRGGQEQPHSAVSLRIRW